MHAHQRFVHFLPARAAAIVSVVCLASVSMSAQAITPTAVAQAAGAPAGTTLQISMQQAVDMAMDANLLLKLQRMNPAISAEDLATARSAYQPLLTSGFSRNTAVSIPTDFTQGNAASVSSAFDSTTAQVSQYVPFHGASYSVNWNANRSSNSAALSSFNPRLGSTATFSFNQPLLQGFSIDSRRETIQTSERAVQITDVQLQQQVVSTDRSVRMAYLALTGAIATRKVAQQVLDVANEQYKNDKSRVGVGTMAPSDIIADEAQVANNEEGVIAADSDIASAEDVLRTLIFDPARPDFWSIHIEPTETPQIEPRTIDLDAAITNALKNRTDLIVARKQLEIGALGVDLLHNGLLPAINANVSYVGQGVGGTQFAFGTGFPPTILSETDRSFGSALGDTFNNAFPSWTYGVTFSYPIGKGAAQATLAKAQLQQTQNEMGLKQQELQVVAAVRDAARQVQTALLQVHAAQEARARTDTVYENAQKKFAVGLTQSFELLQDQRDRATALNAELSAIIAYNRALITFDAVQRIQ